MRRNESIPLIALILILLWTWQHVRVRDSRDQMKIPFIGCHV